MKVKQSETAGHLLHRRPKCLEVFVGARGVSYSMYMCCDDVKQSGLENGWGLAHASARGTRRSVVVSDVWTYEQDTGAEQHKQEGQEPTRVEEVMARGARAELHADIERQTLNDAMSQMRVHTLCSM